jgi:hypothetical protein
MKKAIVCPKMRQLALVTVLVTLVFFLIPILVSGVMLKGSGDPEYNASEPAGDLAGSGWQYQGRWGGFLGTPVAPQYFIAARHVGGAIGQVFEFNGVSYHTVALYDDPDSDLRLWKVDGTFPFWAPLYLGSDENGKSLVVFGRGTQRGMPVIIPCVQTNYFTNVVSLKELGLSKKLAQQEFPEAIFQGQLMTVVTREVVTNDAMKGWKAGTADGRMRWGQNQVSAADSLLTAAFDVDAGDNEAFLSGGDSSGAVFIPEDGIWKLAGINYAVQGPFTAALGDPLFFGAIYDKTGLFIQGMTTPYENTGQPKPACFYAARISPRLPWIMSIIGQ